jgi:hypothetical protein
MTGASVGSIAAAAQYQPDGSVAKPYVIFVNEGKPEAHNGFVIFKVPSAKANGLIFDKYEIRLSIAVEDLQSWTASIPTEEDMVPMAMDPSIQGRVVLVKGRSVDAYNRDVDLINDRLGEQCASTRDVRVAAMSEIQVQALNRAFSRYLIVFPVGVVLDNAILSNDRFVLRTQYAGLRHVIHDGGAAIQANGTLVIFSIAIAGARQVNAPRMGTTAAALFGDPDPFPFG